MSLVRSLKIMARDLKMGPRSPIFFYAILFPIAMTFVVTVVFGSLFEPVPRLGIVDEGSSVIAKEARKLPGVKVTFLKSASDLKDMVRANDFDAGLILQKNFDESLRVGKKPKLNFFIGGESLASNRLILASSTFEMVRQADGSIAPVTIKLTTTGGQSVPLESRLLPMLVMYAVLIAGLFVPAASLVEEREKKTIEAVLVTPVQMPDILAGKAGLGVVLAMATGIMTLVLNNALGVNPGALIIVLFLASLMSAEFGLILGSLAKDTNTLFTFIKSIGALLAAPVIFIIWPGLPQWIAKIFPTYYFLSPLYEIAIKDSSLGQVTLDLSIGFGICAVLIPIVWKFGQRMEQQIGSS